MSPLRNRNSEIWYLNYRYMNYVTEHYPNSYYMYHLPLNRYIHAQVHLQPQPTISYTQCVHVHNYTCQHANQSALVIHSLLCVLTQGVAWL